MFAVLSLPLTTLHRLAAGIQFCGTVIPVRRRLQLAATLLLTVLAMVVNAGWPYVLNVTLLTVTGRGVTSDLLQDAVGADALLHGGNAYPILGQAFAARGIDWPLDHASTHPPSAFLFLLPLADMPWPMLEQVWALFVLAALIVAAWAYGVRGWSWLLLAPLLLWPPVLSSLGQFTALWLLGLALAWRFRNRPFFAGACIALASLTKFLPALSLIPFLRARRWSAVVGFVVIWLLAITVLLRLHPTIVNEYLSANLTTSPMEAARLDNGALLPLLSHVAGPIAALLAVLFIMFVIGIAWRQPPVTFDSWMLWIWVGVALLPIAWTYSLLPLAPVLLTASVNRKGVSAIPATLGLLLPVLAPMPTQSPASVALCIIMAGFASAQARLPRMVGFRS